MENTKPLKFTYVNKFEPTVYDETGGVAKVIIYPQLNNIYCTVKIDESSLTYPTDVIIQDIFNQIFTGKDVFCQNPKRFDLKFFDETREIVVIKKDTDWYYIERTLDPDIQEALKNTSIKFLFFRIYPPKLVSKNKAEAIAWKIFCSNSKLTFLAGAWNKWGVAVVVENKELHKYHLYFAYPHQDQAQSVCEEKSQESQEIRFLNNQFIRAVSREQEISFEKVKIFWVEPSMYKFYINGSAAKQLFPTLGTDIFVFKI